MKYFLTLLLLVSMPCFAVKWEVFGDEYVYVKRISVGTGWIIKHCTPECGVGIYLPDKNQSWKP
jgi:hypothetical protein